MDERQDIDFARALARPDPGRRWRPVARWVAGLAFVFGGGMLLLIAWLDFRTAAPAVAVTVRPPPAPEVAAAPPPLTPPAASDRHEEAATDAPPAAPAPPTAASAAPIVPPPEVGDEAPALNTPALTAPPPGGTGTDEASAGASSAVAVTPPQLSSPPIAPPTTSESAAFVPPAKAAVPAWRRFAVAAPPADGRPRIALIIDDLGIDRPRTARAIALPGPVTLSFIAYAPELPRQTEAARLAGHELLVHVPMEPLSRRLDMGPNGLAVDLPPEEVLRRLRWDLDRFDGYVGINNHMGSRFTGDERSMAPVIGELKARGLLFVDSRTVGNSTGAALARAQGVPYTSRDVFLDDEQTTGQIDARLHDFEATARKHGRAVAIGHPHDATLAALNEWIRTLPEKGFVLVPISDLVTVPAVGN
jgi:polysaccharide deacetylase 2 family uncharacterized protein YibQ